MAHNAEIGFYGEPARLIAALQQLPEGAVVVKNQVGNLAVLSSASNHEHLGFIDLHTGEFVPWLP